jgi:hypothetical protein
MPRVTDARIAEVAGFGHGPGGANHLGEDLHVVLRRLADAVTYLLDRQQENPDLHWEIGFGTEAFRRLCVAEAAATGRPLEEVEKERQRDLQPAHDRREPEVLRLRKELEELRG